MPLEDILRKIEEAAAEECRGVLAEAEEKSRAKIGGARTEASAKRDRIVNDASAQANRAESMARARADAGKRQVILREKQSAIDAVFEKALQSLAALPKDQYKALILRALASEAAGDEVMVLGPEDRERLGADFASQANASLVQSGKPGRLTVEYAKATLGGGFTLSRGGVTQNLTFPALQRRVREEMEIDVARILFS